MKLKRPFLKRRAEPYVPHGECFAVEVSQMFRLRLKIKLKLIGIEALLLVTAVFFVLRIGAIFPIAEQRVADGGEMGANLVRAAS